MAEQDKHLNLPHPGFRPILARKDLLLAPDLSDAELSLRLFSAYEPFFQLQFLDPDEQAAALDLLQNLFDLTSLYWEPTRCRAFIDTFLEQKDKLVVDPKIILQVKPKGYIPDVNGLQSHFWLEVNFLGGHQLVVDPCGGPRTAAEVGKIASFVPFFGPLNQAPEFLQNVYTQGTDAKPGGVFTRPI